MKKIKMWTVRWTQKGRNEYGIPSKKHGFIPLTDEAHEVKFNVSKGKIGRPKMRYAEVYPFFDTKEEAEAYREGNDDWETVSVQMTPL